MNCSVQSCLFFSHFRNNLITRWAIGLGLLLPFVLVELTIAQIDNGGFEGSLNGWSVQGSQSSLSEDAFEGANSCLVTDRVANWGGIYQTITGELEANKDYHFKCYVKLVAPGSRQLRLEILQQDGDNGGQPSYRKIADVTANETEWTLLQGGFTFHPQGQATDLRLIVSGTYADRSEGEEFDFLVDSVQVTENDWRAAADARIELLRMRDIELSLINHNGNPSKNLEVNVQQIGHHFAFGSALNDLAVRTNPIYADFFKEHFEWATFEWGVQWAITEQVRGVEDYYWSDFSYDFVRANGIKIKGHALAYPARRFLPNWLLDLQPAEVQAEVDTRVASAASRYKDDLFGWDVSNELLDEDWLSETVGSTVVPDMFRLAREIVPDAVLFTNENSLTNSNVKTKRYRELVQQLVVDGADVGGIGLQSHFYGGFVSPKAMELTISELNDLGIDLWFTEFDVVHTDPGIRADCLEDFYRYVFSLPEARGINMWGFWAGAHWRGPDASLVDEDWTINAQGQRYLDLMESWTTQLDSNSGSQAEVKYRGFHGSYLVTTFDPVRGITNYHLVTVDPGTDPLAVTLVTNPTDRSLSIYGTSEDDLFEFDLEVSDRVKINGETVVFKLPTALSRVRFIGRDGDDRIETFSKSENQHFKVWEDFMAVVGTDVRVEYEQIETAYFYSRRLGSTVTFVDTNGDDTLTSHHGASTFETPKIKLIADNFRFLFCRSTAGNDTAWLYDVEGLDRLYTDLDVVSLRWGVRNRRVWGFAETNVVSTESNDTATVDLPLGAKTIAVSPSRISIEYNGKQVNAINFPSSRINGALGNSDSVSFSGDGASQILRVSENNLRYSSTGFLSLVTNINKSTHPVESGGYDRVIFTDTAGNDTLNVNQNTATLTSATMSHSWMHFDNIRGTSSNGGTDTVIQTDPARVVLLIGNWISQ